MDISFVIVNYKSKAFVLNCIKSIEEAVFGDLRYEIIVVDNNSDDTIGQLLYWQHQKTIFIKSEKNLGMGGGNNLGLRRARGKYKVVMNPDTLAFADTFSKLFRFMEENPEIGMVGPKQFHPDRTTQDSCYRWHSLLTPIFRRTFLGGLGDKEIARFLMRDYDKQKPRAVDWLLGSCLFIRSKALTEVGLFDERFFLYFEDTDLCRRFWDKNWQVYYYPSASIIHNHNRASARQPWYTFFMSAASRHHLKSWLRYTMKWGLKNPVSH